MTDNTHTDDGDPNRGLTNKVLDVIDQEGSQRYKVARRIAAMIDKDYTPKGRDNLSPSKSSGELEEILLDLFNIGRHAESGGLTDRKAAINDVVDKINALFATQTTKLQAEARIDELKRVDLLAVWDDPRLNGYLEARFIELAQLEREHKIGEDGE